MPLDVVPRRGKESDDFENRPWSATTTCNHYIFLIKSFFLSQVKGYKTWTTAFLSSGFNCVLTIGDVRGFLYESNKRGMGKMDNMEKLFDVVVHILGCRGAMGNLIQFYGHFMDYSAYPENKAR